MRFSERDAATEFKIDPDLCSTSEGAPGLSIVIPVYRGAATIGDLVGALSALQPHDGLELILVNDGSPDNSDEVCRGLVREASVPITYIAHTRNFGEHNAIMTGLRHARGKYIITMDDDLQNPPEEVLKGLRIRQIRLLGRGVHILFQKRTPALAEYRELVCQCARRPSA